MRLLKEEGVYEQSLILYLSDHGADPRYADLLATHKTKLCDFQARTSDPWILKWTYQ